MNFSVIYNAMIKEAGKAQKAARNASRIQNAVQHADALIAKFTNNPVKGVSLQDLQHLRSQISTANKGNIGELEKALSKMEKVIGRAADVTKSVAPTKGAGNAAKSTEAAKATKKFTDFLSPKTKKKDVEKATLTELNHYFRAKSSQQPRSNESAWDWLNRRRAGAESQKRIDELQEDPERFAKILDRYSSKAQDIRQRNAIRTAEVAVPLTLAGTMAGSAILANGGGEEVPQDTTSNDIATKATPASNTVSQTDVKEEATPTTEKGVIDKTLDTAKKYQPELIGAGAGLAGAGGLYALGGAVPGLKKNKLLRAMTALAGGAGIGYGAYALSQPKTASYKEFKNSIKRG